MLEEYYAKIYIFLLQIFSFFSVSIFLLLRKRIRTSIKRFALLTWSSLPHFSKQSMQPAPAYNIDKAKFSLLANSRWVQAAWVGDVHCGAIPLHQREHSPGDKRGEEHYFQVMGGERRGGAIIVFYPLLFHRSCPSTTGIGRRKNVSPSDFAAMEGFSLC